MTQTIHFVVEKETKGAVRYKEVDAATGADAFAPVVATLYVRKSAMPGGKIPPGYIMTLSPNSTPPANVA